ncbi:hypothetical protein L1987_34284 [Smallanthus sonchifolius]|uniref:Uncharacterized protein n=1 Tax=Smallanthus sonchifolius TaxID=185202 RepID=A0ACB9HU40_9ASTR|nr:hypothetical protein L1987_34284 [Smallanthus sonchifolius]
MFVRVLVGLKMVPRMSGKSGPEVNLAEIMTKGRAVTLQLLHQTLWNKRLSALSRLAVKLKWIKYGIQELLKDAKDKENSLQEKLQYFDVLAESRDLSVSEIQSRIDCRKGISQGWHRNDVLFNEKQVFPSKVVTEINILSWLWVKARLKDRAREWSLWCPFNAGAIAGYSLLWLLLWATAIGLLIKLLSAQLGVVTGRHLAELCREEYPNWAGKLLWIMTELALIGADIQEGVDDDSFMAISFAWMFGETKPNAKELLVGIVVPKLS